MGTVPTLRPCPPDFKVYVQFWANHNPAAQIEAQRVTPYPEDMFPMHDSFANRIERDILRAIPMTQGYAAYTAVITLISQELFLFRERITAVREAHEADLRRLQDRTPGQPYDPDAPENRAASARWSEVTGALDDFVFERRILAQRAMKKGRELAYFSTEVRRELDIAPIIGGISVFG